MFTEAQIVAFHQMLVVNGVFKTDRDYKLANKLLAQHFNIDYEEVIDSGHLSEEIDERIRLAKKK